MKYNFKYILTFAIIVLAANIGTAQASIGKVTSNIGTAPSTIAPIPDIVLPTADIKLVEAIGKIGKDVGIISSSKSVISLITTDTTKQQEKDLACLAMNILREAGGESDEGKIGVAQVTVNRVNDPKYPNDVCAVVHQKKIVGRRYVCQFSWYCSKHRLVDVASYDHCYDIAKQVLLSGYRSRKFKDALYYHTVAVKPRWRKKLDMIGRTGNHLFYRNRTDTRLA